MIGSNISRDTDDVDTRAGKKMVFLHRTTLPLTQNFLIESVTGRQRSLRWLRCQALVCTCTRYRVAVRPYVILRVKLNLFLKVVNFIEMYSNAKNFTV